MSEENCKDCVHVNNNNMDDGICYSCKNYYASKFDKKPEENKWYQVVCRIRLVGKPFTPSSLYTSKDNFFLEYSIQNYEILKMIEINLD